MKSEIEPHPRYRVDRLPPDVLDENAQSMLLFLAGRHNLDITQLEDAEIESAKGALLTLPLVHRTNHPRFDEDPHNDKGVSLYDTPVPYSYLPANTKGNTFPLDEELNLDEYVFMAWGAVTPAHDTKDFLEGADTAVLIDPAILESDKCIVTLSDLVMYASINQPVNEIMGLNKLGVESYLQTVVSGKDWLSIQALLLAAAKKEGRGPEMMHELTLGEVKYRGEIPPSAIIASLDLQDRAEYEMYSEHVLGATMGVYGVPTFTYAKSDPLKTTNTSPDLGGNKQSITLSPTPIGEVALSSVLTYDSAVHDPFEPDS